MSRLPSWPETATRPWVSLRAKNTTVKNADGVKYRRKKRTLLTLAWMTKTPGSHRIRLKSGFGKRMHLRRMTGKQDWSKGAVLTSAFVFFTLSPQ